jgi:hypothetical protein
LEKDPQGRLINPDLDPSDTEKLFREHIKMLNEVILLTPTIFFWGLISCNIFARFSCRFPRIVDYYEA